MCGRRFVALLLSLCLFGPSFPSLSYSEETANLTGYESELSRLKVIFARLQAISIQLDLKLYESEKSLKLLTGELESLKAELSDIKNKLTISSKELEALAETLEKSEALLSKVQESFSDYKTEAEKKIARLEKKTRVLTFIAGLLGAGAAGGWIAFAVK